MCSLTMKHTRVVSTKCTPGFTCRAFSDTTLVCFIVNEHTRVVSTKCTPGFACRAFSDTTLVCFIVNEHTTKCSHYMIAGGSTQISMLQYFPSILHRVIV